MPHSQLQLQRRQNGVPPPVGSDEAYEEDFWYSSTAYTIKWAVIGGIFVLFFIFLLAGYVHAQKRMKKGLRPLAYHRWLVPRRQRMQFDPSYQNRYMAYPMNPREQDGYVMNAYAPPPPVYEHNYQNAPAYVPPQGASKANPDQHDYAAIPPPGAPPARNYDAPAYPAPAAGSSARDQT